MAKTFEFSTNFKQSQQSQQCQKQNNKTLTAKATQFAKDPNASGINLSAVELNLLQQAVVASRSLWNLKNAKSWGEKNQRKHRKNVAEI